MREAALATKLIAHLEAFPTAPMDVIPDVRARLKPQLARFRSVVAELANEMDLDPDGGADESLRRIYRRHVTPALQELDDGLTELELGKRFGGAQAPQLQE